MNKRTGKRFITSSGVATSWASNAIAELRQQTASVQTSIYRVKVKGRTVLKRAAWVTPVHVKALFYRDADRGDLCGYQQAGGDALEAAGVVSNDKIIDSWDGSRRLIDRQNPRVEIEVSPM